MQVMLDWEKEKLMREQEELMRERWADLAAARQHHTQERVVQQWRIESKA